jgi:uncharacterized protein YeaO (DUF488 family)
MYGGNKHMIYETYLAKKKEMQEKNPDAIFIEITRSKKHILSPSWNLLNSYKKNNDWDLYTERFLEEMKRPECQEKLIELARMAKEKDIFLVCFEGPKYGKKCHRFIVQELIKEKMNEL